MYSDYVIKEFIILRAEGKTLLQCQKKLDISKPTLVKWNQKYKEEIRKQQILNQSQLYAKRLIEKEESILFNAKQILWLRKSNFSESERNLRMRAVLRDLEQLTGKEIVGVKLNYSTKKETVSEMEILFKSD
ncbi:MAG: hypothetical protein IT279_09275 [Ignavibacteriaceae bacterium]|nr:hypothetical protein [Ignavibacteriaceae bacterium]